MALIIFNVSFIKQTCHNCQQQIIHSIFIAVKLCLGNPKKCFWLSLTDLPKENDLFPIIWNQITFNTENKAIQIETLQLTVETDNNFKALIQDFRVKISAVTRVILSKFLDLFRLQNFLKMLKIALYSFKRKYFINGCVFDIMVH